MTLPESRETGTATIDAAAFQVQARRMPGSEIASVLFATLAGASFVVGLLLAVTFALGKRKDGPKF